MREEVDYVLASGTFSLRADIGDADWEAHVQGVLQGLWERSRRGLGFNLLARGAEVVEPDVYAGDPETWARWCSRALPGARVALRYGPPLPDFTVLVRRGSLAFRRAGSRSTFYDVVLWVHITAVVVAFGALFAYPVFLAVVADGADRTSARPSTTRRSRSASASPARRSA